ncbi:hypothetical protein BDN70DRAFT_495919 [Pholiota conissans]|uniref:MYND-type domain-containing protein n=1 Tax=Pholiota conissans TaxID=109636 RepID=A0A9P6CMV3_9AGAR|nr:hypothetical protein BDN70DRAFT_495919 [Pholiota conissans]
MILTKFVRRLLRSLQPLTSTCSLSAARPFHNVPALCTLGYSSCKYTSMALTLRGAPPLSNSVSDIKDSNFCARRALGALSIGIQQGCEANGRKILFKNFAEDLEFCNSQMRFWFAVRTEEQTQHLLDRLNRCSCPMSDPRIREYHRFGREEEKRLSLMLGMDTQTPSTTYFSLMVHVMAGSLEGANYKSVAKRATRRWPTCPEDLMPYGPQELINSIVVWSKFIPGMVVFEFASLCIRFCGSLLIPHAVESPLTRRAIDAGRTLFDLTWTTVRLRANTRRRAMSEAFTLQIEGFLYYFQDFYDRQPVDKQATTLGGYELKATQVFSLLAYVADDPRLPLSCREATVASLTTQGFKIYRLIGLYIDPMPAVLLHPGICDEDAAASMRAQSEYQHVFPELARLRAETAAGRQLTAEESAKYEFLLTYGLLARHATILMRYMRFTLQCSAQDCHNSIHSTGKTFQRCCKCNLALYCSKTCQQAAWNAEKFPHKTLCKIMRKVSDVAGPALLFRDIPDRDAREPVEVLAAVVASKWHEAHVAPSDLFEIVGWATYETYSPALPEKRECEPGYLDYEEKLTELCERDGASKATSLATEHMVSVHEYTALKDMFSEDHAKECLNEIEFLP